MKGDEKSNILSRMKNYAGSDIVGLVTALAKAKAVWVDEPTDTNLGRGAVTKKVEGQSYKATEGEKNVRDLVKHTHAFPELRNIKKLEEFIEASKELLENKEYAPVKNSPERVRLQDIITILEKLR